MKRTLNPNAGEFHPSSAPSTEPASLRSSPQPQMLPQLQSASVSFREQLLPYLSQHLLQCRTAFCEHAASPPWRQLGFESFLNHCLREAHASELLRVSSPTCGGKSYLFWASHSAAHIAAAHYAVLVVEGAYGTNLYAHGSEMTATTTMLCDLYVRRVRPIVPAELRTHLAARARLHDVPSAHEWRLAVSYTMEILYFFTRLQLLPLLHTSTGTGYSTCVQALTQLRDRLLCPEVASAFVPSALTLMLLAAEQRQVDLRQTTQPHLQHQHPSHPHERQESLWQSTLTATGAASPITPQIRCDLHQLFCAHFPALVVAFLAAPPRLSMEELRHALQSSRHGECIPALRSCPAGAAAVMDLFAESTSSPSLSSHHGGNNASDGVVGDASGHCHHRGIPNPGIVPVDPELLWLTTLLDVVSFAQHHLPSSPSALRVSEDRTSLDRLLRCLDAALPADPTSTTNFQHMALRAAAASPASRDEAVYFCLLALANVECSTWVGLQRLFDALEAAYGAPDGAAAGTAMGLLCSAAACDGMGERAREVLNILQSLMTPGEPTHMQALAEARSVVNRRLKSQTIPSRVMLKRTGIR